MQHIMIKHNGLTYIMANAYIQMFCDWLVLRFVTKIWRETYFEQEELCSGDLLYYPKFALIVANSSNQPVALLGI